MPAKPEMGLISTIPLIDKIDVKYLESSESYDVGLSVGHVGNGLLISTMTFDLK